MDKNLRNTHVRFTFRLLAPADINLNFIEKKYQKLIDHNQCIDSGEV